jgi:hypothetical protein
VGDDTHARYLDHVEAEAETLRQEIRHLKVDLHRLRGLCEEHGIDWDTDD